MNKAQLIAKATKEVDYPRWEVEKVLDAVLDTMIEAFDEKEPITLQYFGIYPIENLRVVFHMASILLKKYIHSNFRNKPSLRFVNSQKMVYFCP